MTTLAEILNRSDVWGPLEVVPCDEGYEVRLSWEGGLALKVAPSVELACDALVESFAGVPEPFNHGDMYESHLSVQRYLGLHFERRQLPPRLQEVSRPFGDLAHRLARQCSPHTPELVQTLRKLVEAKDCAVRSVIESRRERDTGPMIKLA